MIKLLPSVDNVTFRWAGTPVVKEHDKKSVRSVTGYTLKFMEEIKEYSLLPSIPVCTVPEDDEDKFNFETLCIGLNINDQDLWKGPESLNEFGIVLARNMLRGINSYVLFGARTHTGDVFTGLKNQNREIIDYTAFRQYTPPVGYEIESMQSMVDDEVRRLSSFKRAVAYEIESTQYILNDGLSPLDMDILIVDPRIFREHHEDIKLLRYVYPTESKKMNFHIERLDENKKFVAIGSSKQWVMYTPDKNLNVHVRSTYGRLSITIEIKLCMKILNSDAFVLMDFSSYTS